MITSADETRGFRGKFLALGRVLLFWFVTMAALAAIVPSAAVAGEHSSLVIGAVAAFATFCLTGLFVRWEGKSLADFGFTLEAASLARFAGGFLFGLLLVGLHTAIMAAGGAIRWTNAPSVQPQYALLVCLTFLLLSLREELAFRGYPLRKLASDLNPWAAQLIVAVLFAIEHAIGGATWTNAILGAGMGSLVFGMAALATRGLALPIGLHAAWNIGDWARGGKAEAGYWRSVVEPGSEQMANIIGMSSYVAVMALAFLALWAWQRRSIAAEG